MELFDTHAHLDDRQLAADLDGVIERAAAAGVTSIMAVGITADSSARCVSMAEQYAGVVAAIGLQPNCLEGDVDAQWQSIVALSERPEVAAIGETGLDRYWDTVPFELQQQYFDRHLRLAQQLDLPVVIHMRDCGDEIVEMVEEATRRGPLKGVMHSFTGDMALAERCWQLGLHISFAGMVTFKKSEALREVARQVPFDRLLLETDSPYLSPHPMRGKRPNEPARLVHTAECLADVRGIDLDALSAGTTANAKRLFGLPEGNGVDQG